MLFINGGLLTVAKLFEQRLLRFKLCIWLNVTSLRTPTLRVFMKVNLTIRWIGSKAMGIILFTTCELTRVLNIRGNAMIKAEAIY